MNYYLYKLEFSSPVHFGESDSAHSLSSSAYTFCADTLFSALCCTLAQTGDSEQADKLCGLVRNGRLLFSDAMPYCGEELFIPRPLLAPASFEESNPSKRKLMKKLKYVPVSMWNNYCGYLAGKNAFDAKAASDVCKLGKSFLSEKAAVFDNKDAEPYSIGAFLFNSECGIYGIIGYESEEELDFCIDALRLVGLGGIGGKRSSGYGKFTVSDESKYLDSAVSEGGIVLHDMLYGDAKKWMLITTALPCDDELDRVISESNTALTRRGGFSYCLDNTTPQKKKTQYFISTGSVVKEKFAGDLYKAAGEDEYIFRYGKPLFLGVCIDE